MRNKGLQASTDILTKQNLHTHTVYADGNDTPEELVKEALKRGFGSIGFSEHSFLRCSQYPNQLTIPKMELYVRDVAGLKEKYRGKIDIFCGIEYDYYSEIDTSLFDYVIGSVHYLDCGGCQKTFDTSSFDPTPFINENFGGSTHLFVKKYFETVADLPTKRRIDILGHFDLIIKKNSEFHFIDTASDEYLKLGFEAIHSLKGKIPLFEVNTGAISRGYTDFPYPEAHFLNEFRKCGFGAVITSDCHNKNYIDYSFNEAEDLLRAAGFRSRWILTEDGFREVSL